MEKWLTFRMVRFRAEGKPKDQTCGQESEGDESVEDGAPASLEKSDKHTSAQYHIYSNVGRILRSRNLPNHWKQLDERTCCFATRARVAESSISSSITGDSMSEIKTPQALVSH